MNKLESIVKRLERGDTLLSELISLFGEGSKLAKDCGAMLDRAERKINILIKDERTGNFSEAPFAPLETPEG